MMVHTFNLNQSKLRQENWLLVQGQDGLHGKRTTKKMEKSNKQYQYI